MALIQPAVHFLAEFWQVLAEMAPYLLFGFLVAGLLSVWVPVEFIERHLGGRGLWPTLKASLLGIPLPICSCGVIPVSASLRRHGASRGATTSFLLSTPQTGVDSILVTLGMLGPLYAIYRPIAALITGVGGGLIVDVVDSRNGEPAATGADDTPAEGAACTDDCCSDGASRAGGWLGWLWRALYYGFVTLPRDIAKSLLVGLLIAALISTVVPEGFFADRLTGVWAMLAVMLISIPMYICATSSVPMAAAMIAAGLSPGTALVLLVAGPATNAAAVTTLWKILGPRATVTYLLTVAAGALTGGLVLDGLFTATGTAHAHHGMFMLPGWVNSLSGILLVLMVAYAIWGQRSHAKETAMAERPDEVSSVIDVAGMSCGHCVSSVEKALREQAGVKDVEVDLAGGKATVSGNGYRIDDLVAAVNSLGFTATTHG